MDLEYRLDGPANAPVLVLSNSLGTTWTMWDAQFTDFNKYFRVLRYNTRGHGNSPLNGGKMSLASLGKDVIDLMNHLNIEKASFCGISLGGMTGMWLNRHYPNHFNRLVVANTAAKIGDTDAWLTRAKTVRTEGMQSVADGSASRWFTKDYIRARPGIVDALVDGIEQLDPLGYAACCEVLAYADLREEVAKMERPMLVIAGEHDPVTTLAEAEWIIERASDAQICLVPASHLSNIACPVMFSRQTLNYLTSGATHVIND
ncbi:MAG: 3-oxoadipate enol-lactonase [Rouxiella badensis]|uniref:3-oxoadipate enol-lactonase n=1 Tax=Rouxiella badensis TaxID=1646377 RepID=UPI001787C466|nr:3-oxoadipate enol-lactonase [Rouxiella badensis]QOI55122.1 3-oxoadipate enol-lactonase [Rouxiella badensis subsp. acadiensis]